MGTEVITKSAELDESRWRALSASLTELRDEAVGLEGEFAQYIEQIPPSRRPSAVNLLHYLALRRHDLRALQGDLHRMGLSSLGRSEAYVLRSLEAVISVLERLQGRTSREMSNSRSAPDFATGRRLLQSHTEELLGPVPADRRVRIMVTMPTEAADQYDLVRELIHRGMDVMRINCASDGPDRWRKMIDHARRAERELGRPCRVQCDLAGPNPRTGPLELGRGLVRWAPLLNSQGDVHRPARVWVTRCSGSWPPNADAGLPIFGKVFGVLQAGDEIHFTDTTSRGCWLRVHAVEDDGAWTHGDHTAVLKEGLPLSILRNGSAVGRDAVASIPP